MNDIPLTLLLSLLAFMVVLSAFFSASKTGLMTLNRYRLQYLVKQKHSGAIKAQQLLSRPERLLGLILFGNNIVNIFASSLATILALRLWGEPSLAFAVGGLAVILLVFAEVLPKTLAALKPEVIAFPAAYLYAFLLNVCSPVARVVCAAGDFCLKRLNINPKSVSINSLDKEELRIIMAEANALIPPRYHQVVHSIMDLESATVEDIMTPRSDIVGIDLEESFDVILVKIQQSGHGVLPIYKKTIDRVMGFLDVRTLIRHINHADFNKQALMDDLLKPVFIPTSTSLYQQMQAFKMSKGRIGLVVDEYGDVKGMVTLDDLLQELMGEFLVDDPNIKQHSDGSITVDGGVTVREFNRMTNSTLPTEGPKTINGLIIEYMETIPDANISVNLYGYHLEIVERDENTIKQVRFHP